MMGRVCVAAVGFAIVAAFSGTPLTAQSITAGALRGTVRDIDGSALSGAAVTVESAVGGIVRNLESLDDGSFSVAMMLPGTYRILVEMVAYQPVRLVGVVVASGRTTTVSIALTQKPPPITSVTEVEQAGASAGALGRIVTARELRTFDARRDATDLSRGITEVAQPVDGRAGFAEAAGGLPGRRSRLFADGLPEQLLRHPGLPGEPASAPLFERDGADQAQIFGSAPDTEWRGVAGSILGLQTRRGTNALQFSPFGTWSSAKIGGGKDLNPADSSASSFQLGATLSGALVPDTAHFFFRADYQSLETPTAFPWEADSASYRGQAVSLRQKLPSIAADSFGAQLGGAVAPVIRTWKGGSAFGRVDWQLSGTTTLMARAGFTSWKETNPLLGTDVGNSTGSALSARDLSAALALTSQGTSISNEFRIGFSTTRRDWTSNGGPRSLLAGEGVGFGGSAVLPALFDVQMISFEDALQYTKSRHVIKGGLSIDRTSYTQDYRFGASGIFVFGDLNQFGVGTGTYYQAVATSSQAKVAASDIGLFLQDSYSISPELQLTFGLRYQTQVLPKNKIGLNQALVVRTGVHSDSLPKDRRGIQPRISFVWNAQNRGETLVQGSAGLYASGLDLATFAEAMTFDGDVTVRRGQGIFDNWPTVPPASIAPNRGASLTFFSGSKGYRAPRTLKADLGITRVFQGGMTFQVAGMYHHTDFLLRRSDLNRNVSQSGRTQEGRPVYGTLFQQGSLVSPIPGTSRRFADFDLATVLSPNGFSDHYEITAGIERRMSRSLSLMASYTFSRTRDNMVGALRADPADQLSPFPGGIDGANWDESRSDLDIPHRAALTAEYTSGGKYPVTLAARGRFRSGLPFTPGFRAGVDPNGDLAGGNDPVQASSVPTSGGAFATCDGSAVGAFAARNSCRDKSVGSLDVRFAVNLPLKGKSPIALTVDAFNLVSSKTGIVDHAAQLIDPTKNLTTDTNGDVSLPLMANPRFGSLLSRRGEPRLVRFGLRMEY